MNECSDKQKVIQHFILFENVRASCKWIERNVGLWNCHFN